jgi:hypothetical protein
VPAHLLNTATCNGILEAITYANSTEDCSDLVFYLSAHPQFPEFLSFKAASGSLRTVLRYLQKKSATEVPGSLKIDQVIEGLSERILSFFHARKPVDLHDKTNLTVLIKTTNPSLAKLMRNAPHFQHLRFMLISPNEHLQENPVTTIRPEPLEMLNVILKTNDDQLLRNGTSAYKTNLTHKGASGRIRHFSTALEILKATQASEFKTGFIVEWLFEKALVEVLLHEESHEVFVNTLKFATSRSTAQIYIIRGLLRAIQKDFSFLASHPLEKMSDQESKTHLVEKAFSLAQHLFPQLVSLAEKENNLVSKYIANWAMEMPLQNEESRFFKRIHWRWIRTLASHIWDASLREPPAWVVEGGSSYCATIFQVAPALWLQEYSFSLLEKVYHETLGEHFESAKQHVDYVEFLIRAMRKKSPFFASRTESLYALHLLSRLTRTESLQYASAEARFQAQLGNTPSHQEGASCEFALWKEILMNPHFEETLGQNSVTRALAVLARLAKETSKK